MCCTLSHMVTHVTYGHTSHSWSHVSHVFMSEYLYNTILVTKTREVTIPGNSLCLGNYSYEKSYFSGSSISRESHIPGSHISQKVSFPGKLKFWEIEFPGKWYFPGSFIFREVIFPKKSNTRMSQLWDVKFPWKPYFPGGHIFREVIFPGKSKLPERHNYQEGTITRNSYVPGSLLMSLI